MVKILIYVSVRLNLIIIFYFDSAFETIIASYYVYKWAIRFSHACYDVAIVTIKTTFMLAL